MAGEIRITVDGIDTLNWKLDEVITKLNRLGTLMSAATEAIDRLETRISEDFAARTAERDQARAEVVALRALLDAALATETSNAAEIARLTAEGDAIVARVDAIDPIPPVPDPEPEPPVEPPVEPTP